MSSKNGSKERSLTARITYNYMMMSTILGTMTISLTFTVISKKQYGGCYEFNT